MLVFGTEMHIVTFIFVCIETVILFYLVIYRFARPDDKSIPLNIALIFLLIGYNIAGGLFPDPDLPGSFFLQASIAYGMGFITPCYFPFYVYKAFGLKKMKFHAYRGVYLFLVLPYLLFVLVLSQSENLEVAQQVLILPLLYAFWVFYSLKKAIKYKYQNDFSYKGSKIELTILLLSMSSWIGLPIVDYFNLGQTAEVALTNGGFLLLFAFQVNGHVKQTKEEHQRLIESELRLKNWNNTLQKEVDKRTKKLQQINEQRAHNFINLVHETKTPLTIINNYLEEYIAKYGSVEELDTIKGAIDKLTQDVTRLFDIERFSKGINVYNHNQVSNFTEILRRSCVLFEHYCQKQAISCKQQIEDKAYIKADPYAIERIVNNLLENAIKFSEPGGNIEINLKTIGDKIHFTVKDTGIGIPNEYQKSIFEPYYQINHKKTGLQGMGLGLPIVKQVTESLDAELHLESVPLETPGTKINIVFQKYGLRESDVPLSATKGISLIYNMDTFNIDDPKHDHKKRSILLIEDNKAMLNYLTKKLKIKYNVYCTLNGIDALKKIDQLPIIPDLILSDIMMDKMDGYAFAKAIAEQNAYNHIPIIFLTAKSTPSDKLKGLRLGAIDFIQKPFSFEVLNQKVETVLGNIEKQRNAILKNSISNLKAVINSDRRPDNANISIRTDQKLKLYQLTNREVEISKYIMKGVQYKEIAKTLFISEKTVAKHIQNIFVKVNVSNKVEFIHKLNS